MALLEAGHEVIGVDNINDYYDTSLKDARLRRLSNYDKFRFEKLDISDYENLLALPERDDIDRVVHLAAQAGVRYSIENPFAYASSNLTGHLAMLEFARHAAKSPLMIYASSSSVYGNEAVSPFHESADVNHPVSLYAATKRADELMSQAYAKLYNLRQIGVRFFTVYGPWGRPDMAYWTFTDRILKDQTIRVFNQGRMARDFTFIDDAVDGLYSIATGEPKFPDNRRAHRLYNIGNNTPEPLLEFIGYIEKAAGKKAQKSMEPMQPGDVERTCADITAMQMDYGYNPKTKLEDGIAQFVEWFRTERIAATGG